MPELIATLDASRKVRHEEHEFLASIHDRKLDGGEDNSNAWEDLKARVFSKGKAKDSRDVLSLSGQNAQLKGFGIGNGLAYGNGDASGWWNR
jgi:hypothetical protein